ncbi:mRNA stability protein IGO1 [Zalerion maritima]|uniref:mRNA stability protein n=1 Tax=Zalerion maritima TaxID=339359 RepID=A0AAD5WT28_9PEZI|nr:mRNA stability protein IGO1 [Zalerion maritima]
MTPSHGEGASRHSDNGEITVAIVGISRLSFLFPLSQLLSSLVSAAALYASNHPSYFSQLYSYYSHGSSQANAGEESGGFQPVRTIHLSSYPTPVEALLHYHSGGQLASRVNAQLVISTNPFCFRILSAKLETIDFSWFPLTPSGGASAKGPDNDRLRKMFGNRNVEALNKKKTPAQRLLGQDRKYFDSGDWVLSKAGKSDSLETGNVGSEHPVPEKIPHLSSPVGSVQQHHPHPGIHGNQQQQPQQQASSPIKETSFLSQETKAEDVRIPLVEDPNQPEQQQTGAASNENLPIRS